MFFRIDTDGEPLEALCHSDICTNATFVLDYKILCTLDTVFLLEDGQLYIMIADEPIRLQGRWIR